VRELVQLHGGSVEMRSADARRGLSPVCPWVPATTDRFLSLTLPRPVKSHAACAAEPRTTHDSLPSAARPNRKQRGHKFVFGLAVPGSKLHGR
jgi:hypothetical protein